MGPGAAFSVAVDPMQTLQRCQPILGTLVTVSITAETDNETLQSASHTAFEAIRRIHQLMSFHERDSELSRINRNAFKTKIKVSEETVSVIRTALEISAASGGVYDITVARELVKRGFLPQHLSCAGTGDWTSIMLDGDTISFTGDICIDLGGIAKGYAVDYAFKIVCALPIPFAQISINAGGDMRLLNWQGEQAFVRVPRLFRAARLAAVDMQNAALATSTPGKGSQASRIFDPRTRKFAGTGKTVSVFASQCMIADALTKCMSLVPERVDILEAFGAQMLAAESSLR
jgi:thiamine biosynthesis lipoprotein